MNVVGRPKGSKNAQQTLSEPLRLDSHYRVHSSAPPTNARPARDETSSADGSRMKPKKTCKECGHMLRCGRYIRPYFHEAEALGEARGSAALKRVIVKSQIIRLGKEIASTMCPEVQTAFDLTRIYYSAADVS